MNRFFATLTLGLLLAGNLPAETTKFTLGYAGGDPLFKELIHQAVLGFLQENPGIAIEEYPSVAGSSYLDFLLMRDAAGQFPDLVEMRDAPVFQRAGRLAPWPQEISRLIADPVLLEGKVYTLSLVAQVPLGMIYNARFFREQGLAEPKTYRAFLTLLDTIKAKGVVPLTVGGKDLWHLTYWFMKYFLDEVLADNPDFIADRYAGKVRFSDPAMRRALTKWADLFSPHRGWVEPSFFQVADSQTASDLATGKAIMLYSGTWMLQQIASLNPDFEIGWFPVPSSVDDRINLIGGSTAQGWAWSESAARSPSKAQAILQFVKFFFRKDNYAAFLSRLGGIPTTSEPIAYRSPIPVMTKILETYQREGGKQLIWNQKLGANELPPGFRDFAYLQFMELLLGTKDVDTSVKVLDAKWDAITKEFNPTRR